ncbi:MAG: aminotransferase class I/II-fold pyridoxal phosphate-dependent enzyme, partial [Chitinophagia bacterium]|nr:aminotransferase class I/II-fold pyridoxal phosphate-dependent enzyme [Chitinophagia bacterium]
MTEHTQRYYDHYFSSALNKLKLEGNYRQFTDLGRRVGQFPVVKNYSGTDREVTLWCSNDYLGMGQHAKVLEAMVETTLLMGAGAGGTRNISGTNHPLVELELELASLHNKESALVFTSGYVANETTLCTLASKLPDCVIFSDEANHA